MGLEPLKRRHILIAGTINSKYWNYSLFLPVVEAFKDILINILSDTIWAIGGYVIARLLLFKKSNNSLSKEKKFIWSNDLTILKNPLHVAYSDLLKKIH